MGGGRRHWRCIGVVAIVNRMQKWRLILDDQRLRSRNCINLVAIIILEVQFILTASAVLAGRHFQVVIAGLLLELNSWRCLSCRLESLRLRLRSRFYLWLHGAPMCRNVVRLLLIFSQRFIVCGRLSQHIVWLLNRFDYRILNWCKELSIRKRREK